MTALQLAGKGASTSLSVQHAAGGPARRSCSEAAQHLKGHPQGIATRLTGQTSLLKVTSCWPQPPPASCSRLTIMNVREDPRNWTLTKDAQHVNSVAPAARQWKQFRQWHRRQHQLAQAHRQQASRLQQGFGRSSSSQANDHPPSSTIKPGCGRTRTAQDQKRAMNALQRTQQQHPQEVCAAPPKGALLQRLAVLDQKEDVEHKIKACRQQGACQSPTAAAWPVQLLQ